MINFRGRFGRPVWHYLILPVTVLLLAALLFTPIIMRTESALKIRPNQQGLSLPDGFSLYQHLDQRGIRIKSITPENDSLVVSLESPEQQQEAITALQDILPSGYVIVSSESKKRQRLLPAFRKNLQNIG
ncbi:EnvZ/OmpR regulon moderator MzrA [Yersinia enterocolitica]|uniref:Modulator protein MzrA n=1 Tax=Yersinia enterocolitica TaxID=630 RepID=A0A0H5GP45_YEREN|nr:EnvZ/OmpR regulon moderator MzrA [Yersinia enterocolitica]EKN3330453.1 EnvZ/OmpR regulon moderator MzrA [Yersinia enterocolitica]EKN3496537.1 EnvZ/OmpR regulon moderator MzrA [Yersinia enterocolitica]EKN3509881.1 EnvZ/OmpR regulon moderator MzrA [Yersinia enterocolitica]EKN3557413.1 EnvZ/OmpR regulon moderator MzrA [Yersinia enterocolitica]EKN3693477.1 EnvZ/OmpR regulon moderator MzrA [Yersinia enterocolitica]